MVLQSETCRERKLATFERAMEGARLPHELRTKVATDAI